MVLVSCHRFGKRIKSSDWLVAESSDGSSACPIFGRLFVWIFKLFLFYIYLDLRRWSLEIHVANKSPSLSSSFFRNLNFYHCHVCDSTNIWGRGLVTSRLSMSECWPKLQLGISHVTAISSNINAVCICHVTYKPKTFICDTLLPAKQCVTFTLCKIHFHCFTPCSEDFSYSDSDFIATYSTVK